MARPVRSSVIRMELFVELLLLHVKRKRRWFGHLIRMHPEHFSLKVIRHVPLVRGPGTDPVLAGGIAYLL